MAGPNQGESLFTILLPQVVLREISLLKPGVGAVGSWLGFHPTTYDPQSVRLTAPRGTQASSTVTPGMGVEPKSGQSVRNVTYRIFNATRVPMKARAPGTGPATVARNPVGTNTVAVARYHEKIPLLYEELGNLSPIIGPNAQVDQGGADYIQRMTRYLAEKANITIELMAVAMLRNSLYFILSGDNWLPQLTAPTSAQVGFQVNFNIPAANTGQLPNAMGTQTGAPPIIDTSWNNPNAPIMLHLPAIKAAFSALTQYTMTDVWCNSLMWYNIVTNNSVRNVAGTVNTPFATFDKVNEGGLDNKYFMILAGEPSIRWHFTDDTVTQGATDIDPINPSAPTAATQVKYIPDNMAIFTPAPSRDWAELYEGGEYVVENYGMPATLRTGFYFWHQYNVQPSNLELLALLNAVPILYNNLVVAPASVIF